MVIIDISSLLGGLTLDPAGMHCPWWDDAFVSSLSIVSCQLLSVNQLTSIVYHGSFGMSLCSSVSLQEPPTAYSSHSTVSLGINSKTCGHVPTWIFTNFKNFLKFANFYEFSIQKSGILNLWLQLLQDTTANQYNCFNCSLHFVKFTNNT